eukprot:Rmarinus@m.4628
MPKGTFDSRKSQIEQIYQHEQYKEELLQKFADKASEYDDWFRRTITLVDSRFPEIDKCAIDVACTDMKTLMKYKDKLEKDDARCLEVSSKYIKELEKSMKKLEDEVGVTREEDNPFTVHSMDTLLALNDKMKTALKVRSAAFNDEMKRVKTVNAVYEKFEQAAAEFEEKMEDITKRVLDPAATTTQEFMALYKSFDEARKDFEKLEDLVNSNYRAGKVDTNQRLIQLRSRLYVAIVLYADTFGDRLGNSTVLLALDMMKMLMPVGSRLDTWDDDEPVGEMGGMRDSRGGLLRGLRDSLKSKFGLGSLLASSKDGDDEDGGFGHSAIEDELELVRQQTAELHERMKLEQARLERELEAEIEKEKETMMRQEDQRKASLLDDFKNVARDVEDALRRLLMDAQAPLAPLASMTAKGAAKKLVQAYKSKLEHEEDRIRKRVQKCSDALDDAKQLALDGGVAELELRYNVNKTEELARDIDASLQRRMEEFEKMKEGYMTVVERQAAFDEAVAAFESKVKKVNKAIDASRTGSASQSLRKLLDVWKNGDDVKSTFEVLQKMASEARELGNKNCDPVVNRLRKEKLLPVYKKAQMMRDTLCNEAANSARYYSMSQKAKKWAKLMAKQLRKLDWENNLDSVLECAEDFRTYAGEKAKWLRHMAVVAALKRMLDMLLDEAGRPLLDSAPLEKARDAFELLPDAERYYHEQLKEEIRRMQQVVNMAQAFRAQGLDLQDWILSKMKFLDQQEGDVGGAEKDQRMKSKARSALHVMSAFESEYEERREDLDELEKLANEIAAEAYWNFEEIESLWEEVSKSWTALRGEKRKGLPAPAKIPKSRTG